jgi:hypothetical protein
MKDQTMKRGFILFIVVTSLMVAGTSCTQLLRATSPSITGAEPAPTLQPVKKILSTFTPVQGTNHLMAGIISAPVSRENSLNPLEWINNSSYSSYSSGTYNYVFFNLDTEEYKRLLPTNEYVIFQTASFPTLQYDPAEPDKPAPIVKWWVYSIIKKDTNHDGSLGYEDKITIGISDVGGSGYTELVENVDAIQGQIYKDDFAMFIMYNADRKNFIAKINPSTREVLSTTEMDLGEDVK